MKPKVRTVAEYLDELERTKGSRPDQVKEGLAIYIELWRKAVEGGVISLTDDVEGALEKIDKKGGLYSAADA